MINLIALYFFLLLHLKEENKKKISAHGLLPTEMSKRFVQMIGMCNIHMIPESADGFNDRAFMSLTRPIIESETSLSTSTL